MVLDEYTPLTNEQKLMALWVLLKEKNGTELKKHVTEALKKQSNKSQDPLTIIEEILLRQYGAENLKIFQIVLLETIHNHSYKIYVNSIYHRYSSKPGIDLSTSKNAWLYTTEVERYWSEFFVKFDKEIKLKKSEEPAQEKDERRCQIM